MALKRLDENLNFVESLGDDPKRENGLSTSQFKAVFDKAGLIIQNFINNTLIPGIENAISEEGLLSQISKALSEKLDKKGGTVTGRLDVYGSLNMYANLNMNEKTVSGLASPVESGDAVPKKYADTKRIEKTLLAIAWSGSAPYTQSITVDGLNNNVFARVYPVYPAALKDKLELSEETAKVRNCTRSGAAMTFECWEEKPDKDIPIIVEVYV